MSNLHPAIARVTDRVIDRSRPSRTTYLDLIERQRQAGSNRTSLSCGNFAHGFASAVDDKRVLAAANLEMF